VLFTRDIAAITMDLNGIEHIAVRALGSADTVTVGDLAGTDVKSVDVDLSSFSGDGDGAADTVIALGTDGPDKISVGNEDAFEVVDGLAAETRVTGGESTDAIDVAGLGGDDTLTTTSAVTGTTPVTFDGGEGQDTTRYNGTAGDDQIGIAANGGAAATFAVPNGVVVNTPATVESLVVSGLGGNDTIQGQNGIAGITALTIDGGAGDDNLGGGDGADLMIGGSGNDHVDGNRGNDTAQLGSGDDHFQWDPGDGSDVVEGQGGNDQLDFNGSNAAEQMAVSANGARVLFTRDIAAITMDLNGIEHIAVRALGSADTITVNDLAGTDVDSVDVDLSSFSGEGDEAADTVVVNGTDRRDVVQVARDGGQVSVSGLKAQTEIVGSEPALDRLIVNTLAGNDDVTVAPDVGDLIATAVDLGTDE
jgi:Ca2+-binding RTX toxin-like protein